jgi:GntR family transcriptional regulator, galactonate operon transcriptional repressor
VLDGEFGERIPREEDLTEAFGVSRGTARSAVSGSAGARRGQGDAWPARCSRAAGAWSLFDAPLLEAVLESRIGPDVLAEALECRLLVAPEAAALAAERASDVELEDLGERLARVLLGRRGGRLGLRLSPELEFHLGVIEASHNRFLSRIAATIETAIAGRVKPGADAVAHQQRILDALMARDATAAREAMHARIVALVPVGRRRAR